MVMNKQKGNMYGFVTHTWNAIKGRCSHGCSYCYMIPFWKSDVHLDEKELKTHLGEGNVIFVGSSTDMFAEDVPSEWIKRVLKHCEIYQDNTYLFQSKNPKRFTEFKEELMKLDCVLGTTIETDREDNLYNAPKRSFRAGCMEELWMGRKMVTIEPIMDFNVSVLLGMLRNINPEFVNIGADSKGHNLQEPSNFKIANLIEGLAKFTKVNLKDNLKRLYTS